MGGMGRGGGFPGRKFSAADLQLLILALLAERPSHGYEIIKALDERSGGFYSPSPGMIYPALTFLEEIGHATVEAEGARKLYSITEEGERHLEENRAEANAMLAMLVRIGARMDRVRRAFTEEGGEEEIRDGGPTELRAARHALRSALHARGHDLTAEEARRIAGILRRAAADILGEDGVTS
jgi:DNA-binding PadR family transcriptional regulator